MPSVGNIVQRKFFFYPTSMKNMKMLHRFFEKKNNFYEPVTIRGNRYYGNRKRIKQFIPV